MKDNQLTRKGFLALPRRQWDVKSEYDSLTIVPTYEVHDSGYRLMAIVGHRYNVGPVEIAAFCDDITWAVPQPLPWYIRTEMDTTNNFVHMWGNGISFRVGYSVSSTEIEVIQCTAKVRL